MDHRLTVGQGSPRAQQSGRSISSNGLMASLPLFPCRLQFPNVGHARHPNEFLEVLGNELRPVVRDVSGPSFRMNSFARSRMISMPASVIDSRTSQFTM